MLLIATVLTRAELAQFFSVAGLRVLAVKAPPAWGHGAATVLDRGARSCSDRSGPVAPMATQPAGDVILQIRLFFTKAGAFVSGSGHATAAATGANTGSVVMLGQRAIVDLPTAPIGLLSPGVLSRFKLHEPVVAAAVAGLALWPLVRGGGAG